MDDVYMVRETDAVPHAEGRRAANKARRKRSLLDGCRALVAESGSTEFTMQRLADVAGLSLATSYNLIGTKSAILYELLNRSLDDLSTLLEADRAADNVAPLRRAVQLAARFFAAEPDYYRPLMRYLLGVYEPDKRPFFMARALGFWRSATKAEGKTELAMPLHLSFAGALDLWVHGEIDGDEFEALMGQQAELLGRGASAV